MGWSGKMEKGLKGEEKWGRTRENLLPFLLPSTYHSLAPEARETWGQETATSQVGIAALKQSNFRISFHKIKRLYN